MKRENLEFMTRLGPKSQIVLKKEIRESLGLAPGSLVKLRKLNQHIEIKPIKKEEIIAEVEKIAKMVSKKIRKDRTSVDIIREQRD